jgi:hypothetical protein
MREKEKEWLVGWLVIDLVAVFDVRTYQVPTENPKEKVGKVWMDGWVCISFCHII